MDSLSLYIQQLEECLYICSRLENLLEDDSDRMNSTFRGEIGENCQKACTEAIIKIEQIKKQVSILMSV